MRIITIALLLTCQVSSVPSADVGAPVVVVPLGDVNVILTVVGGSAFRIGVGTGAEGLQSPMVAPREETAFAMEIRNSTHVGLRTRFGEVTINVASGLITLVSAKGQPITQGLLTSQPNTCAAMESTGNVVGATGKMAQNKRAGRLCHRDVQLQLSKTVQTTYYGGGGGKTGGVDKDPFAVAGAVPFVGNTKWLVPSYWSTDGYAALAVADHDSAAQKLSSYPASWRTNDTMLTWVFEGNRADVYLMPSENISMGISAISALTGGTSVPPRYAFGFLACRWGWSNRSVIEDTLQRFRDGRFPLDAFISDYGWFTDSPNAATQDDFGYNSKMFPHPRQQLAQYHSKARVRFGGIRKPRIDNSSLLDEAKQAGYILSGTEHQLNFSSTNAQTWYAAHQAHYLQDGVDFWWNDEGETQYFNYHLWNEAHSKALTALSPHKRLFTLNRAYTPGMGRLGAAIWTGDIFVSWKAFQETPGTVLRWSLAGAVYIACDTGGFEGGNTPAELLVRWYQLSATLPLMRTHSRVQWLPHWPWLYGKDAEVAMREALDFRYQLLPFMYSLAHQAWRDGSPIIRPLMMDFLGDTSVAHVADQYTLGGRLMVAPVMEQGATSRRVLLPRGSSWFEFNSTVVFKASKSPLRVPVGLRSLPLYVLQGTVLPLAPPGLQYSDALPGGALIVQVYAGTSASFLMTEDDGETLAYRTGKVRALLFEWHEPTSTLHWSCSGSFKGSFMQFRVTLFRAGAASPQHSEVLDIGMGGHVHLVSEELIV